MVGERFRVTKVPRGGALKWVRVAWVGLELPCVGSMRNALTTEVGSRILELVTNGVLVPQREALRLLAEKSPEAAKWWRDAGFPDDLDQIFVFRPDEGTIIGQN